MERCGAGGKETEIGHGVLEVQAEVQAVEQSLQQVQICIAGRCTRASSAGAVAGAGAGRLSPPDPRHPHLGRVAEVDLQVDVVLLVHCVLQEVAT